VERLTSKRHLPVSRILNCFTGNPQKSKQVDNGVVLLEKIKRSNFKNDNNKKIIALTEHYGKN